MITLEREIRKSVKNLISSGTFQEWLKNESVEPGDYIVINNSFVFRDVKTTKSELFLCLTILPDGKLDPEPKIAKNIRINSDFKRYSYRSNNLPALIKLKHGIAAQLNNAGHLLFLLVGHIQDNIVLRESTTDIEISEVVWDPSLGEGFHLENGTLYVGDTYDETAIWTYIHNQLSESGKEASQELRESIGTVLDKLQDQAVAKLEIPSYGTPPSPGVTDAIVQVLREQRDQYERALNKFVDADEPSALNEILRIAYNFASDATEYIRLVVSICDLKPLVLWGTIDNHLALSEEFRRLPWLRSRNKPSLQNYELTIGDARNSAFHNLFPFRKSLRVILPETALRQAELIIFSEHARKKDNRLTYQDMELVEVLKQFTRARERRVSVRFWKQNLLVMNATIILFASSSQFIKILHQEMKPG